LNTGIRATRASSTAACTLLGIIVLAPLGSFPTTRLPDESSRLQWSPPDVDAPIASVDPHANCPLAEILAHAGERTKQLADNLEKFGARETIRFKQLDEVGAPLLGGTAIFDYAAQFSHEPGKAPVQETRRPINSSQSLPNGMQDSGVMMLALIFHPTYQSDYEMRCEGQGTSNGERAWVIHFEQRKDKPARTRGFRTQMGLYEAKLKGRAWISPESNQILRIETNLMQAIPMIGVLQDAVTVSYAAVKFRLQTTELWLPESAEAFSDFGRYRSIIEHRFTDFVVYSVESQQVIGKPKEQ
jgi:hypothetical protein